MTGLAGPVTQSDSSGWCLVDVAVVVRTGNDGHRQACGALGCRRNRDERVAVAGAQDRPAGIVLVPRKGRVPDGVLAGRLGNEGDGAGRGVPGVAAVVFGVAVVVHDADPLAVDRLRAVGNRVRAVVADRALPEVNGDLAESHR